MLDAATIREMQRKAAARACRLRLVPFVVWPEDLQDAQEDPAVICRRIPFLGDYVPPGWQYREDAGLLFVDSTGMGEEGEPALTVRQFIDRLQEGDALGIVEAGEFQVLIAKYDWVPQPGRERWDGEKVVTEE